VTQIKFYACQPGQICNIDDMNYAWYQTSLQQYWTGTPQQSAIPYKYTSAQCVSGASRAQNLNNGRRCSADYECKSKQCQYTYCRGQQMGEPCHSHEDCDVSLACKAATTWPFKSTCQRLGLQDDACSTDFDCHPKTFCWYKYSSDIQLNLKRCLTKYSQDTGTYFGWVPLTGNPLKDAVHNGKYCQTGWAWNSDGNTQA
jgi:hypothetical protein